MRRVNLKAGDVLFEKGDTAKEAFLIMEGTIEIVSEALAVELGEDELFGESGLIGNTRQAAAIAKTNCRLFAVTVEELRQSIQSEPDTALLMVEALIRRLAYALNELEAAKRLTS